MCCEQGPAGTKSIGALSEEQTTQKLWNWGQALHPDKQGSFCTCEMGRLDHILKTLLLWPCLFWKPWKRIFGCNHNMFACWCGFACHSMTPWKQTTHSHGYLNYACREKLQLGVCANVWIFPPHIWLETGQTHVGNGRSTFQCGLETNRAIDVRQHNRGGLQPGWCCNQLNHMKLAKLPLFTHINVDFLISSSLSLLMWFLSLGNCLSLCDPWKSHSSISDLAGHSIECLRTMCQRHSPRIAVWSPKRNLHFKERLRLKNFWSLQGNTTATSSCCRSCWSCWGW